MDKILVVDDEIINLMMVKNILEPEYEVIEANSCEEALALLKDMTPTIILLDIHMPEIDGYETLIKIRNIERLKDIPIVFLTADDESRAEVRGFELGADDFVRKPFVSEVVKHRVAKCIENYKLHHNLKQEVERQAKKVESRTKELNTLSSEIIQTLTSAIDAKDIYTKGHSSRVAEYAVILAKSLGWDEYRIEKLYYTAILHDIGKIGVPDRVLNKDGKLTDEEFELIKSHTVLGADLLQGMSHLSDMYQVAKHHHERYDGKGYPDKLSITSIPEEARLVCIADSYDAMSSDRVYRKALKREVIREELVKGRGTQFDPHMLDVFLELFDNDMLKLDMDNDKVKGINTEIQTIISTILTGNKYSGAFKLSTDQLSHIYSYMSNIHERYGISLTTIVLGLVSDEDISQDELDKAMNAMEYSINQSLRNVDIMNRLSYSQFLLILTNAKQDSIQTIIDRIIAGFYKNCTNVNIKPIYEIKRDNI